jgi:hypothetical protein
MIDLNPKNRISAKEIKNSLSKREIEEKRSSNIIEEKISLELYMKIIHESRKSKFSLTFLNQSSIL